MSATDSFQDFELAGWSREPVCNGYDRHFGAITIQSAPTLLDSAHVVEGVRVLDVGCGAGYVAGLAADRGADTVGIDFSPAQVELAATRYPNVDFRCGDATAVKFEDRTFDCVVNGFGMPHFEDPDAAIAEAFRLLRPGKRYSFSVWAKPDQAVGFGLLYTAVQSHGRMDVGIPTGPSFFLFSDIDESQRRLTDAGFRDVEFVTVPQTWYLSSAEELMTAIMNGTVRAAAMLRGQDDLALENIKAVVAEQLVEYSDGGRFKIPMPAVVASAAKP